MVWLSKILEMIYNLERREYSFFMGRFGFRMGHTRFGYGIMRAFDVGQGVPAHGPN